ncbi:MAG: VOC family protein [Proteobacteria bacterium]|nr:VOC family protein [Pseudomonadota bacterium]
MSQAIQPKVEVGPFNHIGLVVEDIDKAIEIYTTIFGLGPFTSDTYELKGVLCRGKPLDAVIKGGFVYSGDFMIELVEVVSGETPHAEFFAKKGEGVQHIAFSIDDMEKALAALAEEGIETVLEYKFIANNAPVSDPDPAKRRPMEVWEAYLDTEGRSGGTVIQLMQLREVSEDSDVQYVANPGDA